MLMTHVRLPTIKSQRPKIPGELFGHFYLSIFIACKFSTVRFMDGVEYLARTPYKLGQDGNPTFVMCL